MSLIVTRLDSKVEILLEYPGWRQNTQISFTPYPNYSFKQKIINVSESNKFNKYIYLHSLVSIIVIYWAIVAIGQAQKRASKQQAINYILWKSRKSIYIIIVCGKGVVQLSTSKMLKWDENSKFSNLNIWTKIYIFKKTAYSCMLRKIWILLHLKIM